MNQLYEKVKWAEIEKEFSPSRMAVRMLLYEVLICRMARFFGGFVFWDLGGKHLLQETSECLLWKLIKRYPCDEGELAGS